MTESDVPLRSFGYARVSTVGQTLEAQLAQLTEAGCAPIYREKVSGAKADRRELQKLIKALQPGDEVVVTRIDRLARSTFDLFGIVKRIVDAGARFRSLAEPWADTSNSTGRLMLAVLGGLADVERDLIRTRTAEGRAAPRHAGCIWVALPASPRRNSRRCASGSRMGRLTPTLRAATRSASRLFNGSRSAWTAGLRFSSKASRYAPLWDAI